MRRLILLLELAMALSLVVVTGLGQGTSPCTIYVQPGESIQAVIDQAHEGATICLGVGEWQENLKIDEPVTLRGAGPDKTILHGEVWIFGGAGLSVEIDGINIRSGGINVGKAYKHSGMMSLGEAIEESKKNHKEDRASSNQQLQGSAKVKITDCNISGKDYGVSVGDSAEIIFQNSSVSGEDAGIVLWDTAMATFQSSTVTEGLDGIVVGCSAGVILQDSTISGSFAIGLLVQDSAKATLLGSTITSVKGPGIVAEGTSQVIVEASTISDNRGDGIALYDQAVVRMANDRIVGNHGYGVRASWPECTEHHEIFAGRVSGERNLVADCCEENGNRQGALCPPYPGPPWPRGLIENYSASLPMEPRPNLYFPNLNIHRMKAVSVSSFEDYFYGATYVQDVVNNGGPGRVFVSVTLKIRGHIVAFASTVFDIGAHETVTLEAALYLDSPVKCDWGVTGYRIPKQVLDWSWHVAQSGDRPEGKITVIRGR